MKVLCTKKDLHEAVSAAGRVPGRTPLPILTSFLLRTVDGGLEVTAYDLEVGVRQRIPASVQEAGAVTISIKLLSDLVSALPDSNIELTSDAKGQMRITCERSSFDLLGLPADEYPSLPEVGDERTVTLPAAAFRSAVGQVAFAASTDEARAVMTGIVAAFKQEAGVLTLAATDGHRLAVRNIACGGLPFDASAIVPARALSEVARMLPQEGDEKVTIRLSDSQALFECGNTSLVTRLIDGQFPNYERVIPANAEKTITAQTQELAQAVRRVSIVAREASNRVVLATDGERLVVSAESGGVGKAREDVEVIREGDDIEIAFNSKYVADVLNAVASEGVRLELTGNLSPGLIRPVDSADYLYVIMPMQIV